MNEVKQCSKRDTISRMKMAKHLSLLTVECCLLLIITTTMIQSSAARSLLNSSPAHPHNHHKITFLMPYVLDVSRPSSNSKPATTKLSSQLPFSKPIGMLPPYGPVPLPETNPTTQTVDLPGIGLFFPTRATLQELEFGIVTLINEDIFESSGYIGPQVIGKVQGVYVESSEDGSSHMMAMSAHFSDSDFKDGLRFFGVHWTNVHDGLSHVAVIGGVGKFAGADGYATVKRVNNTRFSGAGEGGNELLMLNVYLSE